MSHDKRWIVTADEGSESILVVWDSMAGTPVKTIFSPHPNGSIALDMTRDSLFIAVLTSFSSESPQEVMIFGWTREGGEVPLFRERVKGVADPQHSVCFDVSHQLELATTGNASTTFWNWDSFHLEGYAVQKPSAIKGALTSTVFIPNSGAAITSSEDGHIIVWESEFSTIYIDNPTKDTKVMRSSTKVRFLPLKRVQKIDYIMHVSL